MKNIKHPNITVQKQSPTDTHRPRGRLEQVTKSKHTQTRTQTRKSQKTVHIVPEKNVTYRQNDTDRERDIHSNRPPCNYRDSDRHTSEAYRNKQSTGNTVHINKGFTLGSSESWKFPPAATALG